MWNQIALALLEHYHHHFVYLLYIIYHPHSVKFTPYIIFTLFTLFTQYVDITLTLFAYSIYHPHFECLLYSIYHPHSDSVYSIYHHHSVYSINLFVMLRNLLSDDQVSCCLWLATGWPPSMKLKDLRAGSRGELKLGLNSLCHMNGI